MTYRFDLFRYDAGTPDVCEVATDNDTVPPIFVLRIGTDKEGRIWFPLSDVCRTLDVFRSPDGGRNTQRAILFVEPEDRLVPSSTSDAIEAHHRSDLVDQVFVSEPGVRRLAATASDDRSQPFLCWIDQALLPMIVDGPV